MKIGIIGAGVTGLSAAYELGKKGHKVVVFEQSGTVGGLATYTKIGGDYIEQYYHHIFESDQQIIELARELEISEKLKFYQVKTGIFSGNRIYPFSSATDLLRFAPLSALDRLRCGLVFGVLKLIPFPLPCLDTISAKEWILRYAGEKVYKKVWGPLLEGKFSKYAPFVPALWLWGRIKDRSLKLGYFYGSVKILFDSLTKSILSSGGIIKLNHKVLAIPSTSNGIVVKTIEDSEIFDKVLITTVSPLAEKLMKDNLPSTYRKSLAKIDHLGVTCVIAELKYPVQSQYWLNICDKKAPVLVMIEHTNMINRRYYKGNAVLYLANYIHRDDKLFNAPDEMIIGQYLGFLKKINKYFSDSWIVDTHIFRSSHAQTIFSTGSLTSKPRIETPLPNIYMTNIDQMYPHDRNLNQGALLGKKAADIMTEDE